MRVIRHTALLRRRSRPASWRPAPARSPDGQAVLPGDSMATSMKLVMPDAGCLAAPMALAGNALGSGPPTACNQGAGARKGCWGAIRRVEISAGILSLG